MPELPAVPESPGLSSAVEAVFADDGPLARALPQYEPRRGQRQMAEAVADTLAHGGVLLAEAGTGTGKTLAYLVPAILSGRRVLVSTGTKNLQEQIYDKDLPVLRRALGVDFTATCMKGRANYVCLHRLEQARGSGRADGLLEDLARWAEVSETGDRAELADLAENDPLWHDLSATAETCLGSDCPQFDACFVTRMRQRAAASDLVIVNHHLLCADAAVRQSSYGEVIPACHYAVVDEAHQLEDVATQYFGIAVSNYRLDELGRDVERLLNAGVIGDEDGSLRRMVRRADDHARAFFGALALARASRAAGGDRLRVGPDWFGDIVTDGVALVSALDGLEGALNLAASGESGDAAEDALALARRAGEVRDQLRFLMSASDARHVYFIEARGRGVFLRAAPIDVADILQEVLFDRMRATVLTSATLTVQGAFDYVRGRLGVRGAAEITVPSEFDYARQAVLYLPRRMPAPRDPGFGAAVAHEVQQILRRTEGRAFVLFTSYGVLREVQARIQPVLPYPLLVQGDAPRSVLLQRFRETRAAVLLATSSFWQGVDVVGDQLSCVIIDKLPFASPGDPITAARVEAIAAEGGDPFRDYQVPLAVLTMLQGLGRLIRHRDDRGVLAVLDPRLKTMAYGRRFLDSFPPAPVTHDLGEVGRFMGAE